MKESLKQALSLLIAFTLALCGSNPPRAAAAIRARVVVPAGAAVGVIPALSGAVAQTIRRRAGSVDLRTSLPALNGPDLLTLPVSESILTPRANANLAHLFRLAEPDRSAAVLPSAPGSVLSISDEGPKAERKAVRKLRVANAVLSRFDPARFRKLPAAKLRGILNEIWDGIAGKKSLAAPIALGRSDDFDSLDLSPGFSGDGYSDLVLRGMSPEMLDVVEGEILFWEPEQREIDPYIVGHDDNPATVRAKVHNELGALEQAWSVIEWPLAEDTAEDALAVADRIVGDIAGDIRKRKMKAEVLLEKALSQMHPGPGSAEEKARELLERELLPALKDRESLIFLSAARGEDIDLEAFHRELAEHEKDLVMIKMHERFLRFPYGFSAGQPKEMQDQRTIASARRGMMAGMAMMLDMEISGGKPAEQALRSVEAQIEQLVEKFEKTLIADSKNRTVRANLTTFQELLAAFQAVRSELRTYDYVFSRKDAPSARKREKAEELARHEAVIARLRERYRNEPEDFRALIDDLDASIREEVGGKGRPLLRAAAKYFHEHSEELGKKEIESNKNGTTNPIELLMFYSHVARGGALGDEEVEVPDRDIIVFAKAIRDESDYEELRMRFRRYGRIRAIVTPKLSENRMGGGRVPHWVIFAKADGIVALPLADMEAAGVEFDALRESFIQEDDRPSIAVADGKRGHLLVQPTDETRADWLSRNVMYHKLDRFYRDRAAEPVSFEGRAVSFLADEADPKTFKHKEGG
ncbi:MAG: hypothetical protein V3S11_02290, partial [Elusimicrobiota bacterium]